MELIYVLAIILILLYIWYINLIFKRNSVKRALSGIDVQLKKRSNLLPEILKIAKKFMDKEIKLLEEVTAMRSNALNSYDSKNADSVKTHLQDISKFDKSLSQFMVNVENYPELKSDQSMLNAQATFNEVEEQIAAARRFYNSAVTSLNNAVEIFPGNILAKFVGIRPMPFYETEDNSKQVIDADQYL